MNSITLAAFRSEMEKIAEEAEQAEQPPAKKPSLTKAVGTGAIAGAATGAAATAAKGYGVYRKAVSNPFRLSKVPRLRAMHSMAMSAPKAVAVGTAGGALLGGIHHAYKKRKLKQQGEAQ